MLPAPVRVETNASFVPSGEYSGLDSVAGFVTRRCASPPADGTVQISPPDANAISFPSGDIAGSLNEGKAACAIAPFPASKAQQTRTQRSERRRTSGMTDTSLQLVEQMKKFYTTCRFVSPLRIATVSGGNMTTPSSAPTSSRDASNKGHRLAFFNSIRSVPRLHITVTKPRSIT